MHYLTVVGNDANTLTFAFMHHPYLVCILFGMPSLHLFTFLMIVFLYFFGVNLSYLTQRRVFFSSVRRCDKLPQNLNSIDSLVVLSMYINKCIT